MLGSVQISGTPMWILVAAASQEPAAAPAEGEPPPPSDKGLGTRTRIVFKGVGGSAGSKQTMPDAPVTASGKRHERKLATRRRRALLLLLAFAGSAVVLTLICGTVAATQRMVRVNQTLAEEIQHRAYRFQPETRSGGDASVHRP